MDWTDRSRAGGAWGKCRAAVGFPLGFGRFEDMQEAVSSNQQALALNLKLEKRLAS